VTEEHFYRAINTATGKADLTLLVADFFDPEGSFGPNWADLINGPGAHGDGIHLLVNKADLIPPKTPQEEIQNLLADLWRQRFPGIKLAGVRAVSAHDPKGLGSLLKEMRGLKAALIGAANVGKSSLLVKIMTQNSRRTARKAPTISSFPGTTQGITHWHIPSLQLELADTPGIIPHTRMGDQLCPECSGRLLPRRRLQTKLWEIPTETAVLFGDLACVWSESARPFTAAFFTSEALTLHRTNKKKGEALLAESPQWLRAICTEDRRKLVFRERVFTVQPGEDLYISGLGWMAVKKETAHLRLRVAVGVETGVRPTLIGKK